MVQIRSPLWSRPPIHLGLPKESVHIWSIGLDVSAEPLQRLAQTLSADEQHRANQFHFERDRRRFIAGRGTLRSILGQYLKVDPVDLQFSYGTNGKPTLIQSAGSPRLSFNLSHSQNLMLCAIAQSPIGVDLEHLRPVHDLPQLTQRFFTPQEHRTIQALSPEQQLTQFFWYWTCKEALLKATGLGVTGLGTVEVSICNGVVEHITWMQPPHPVNDWCVELFSPAPEYVAAIATSSSTRHGDSSLLGNTFNTALPLVFWQWQEPCNLGT